ncbi:MAG: hypothetical protein IJ234_02405 [Clostridia bacterium]|nr:hypothetical protein [Clostridia bacterium]
MSETTGKWRCPYCDGLNSAQDAVCLICGDGRRPQAEPLFKAAQTPAIDVPKQPPAEASAPMRELQTETPASVYTQSVSGVSKNFSSASASGTQSERAGVGFGIFAAAFAVLTLFDSLFAWYYVVLPYYMVGTWLCPQQPSSYGLLCMVFLGLMPLAALWLRSKGIKALAVPFALAGCACGAAAVFAMVRVRLNGVLALGWALYAVATLLVLLYSATGAHGRRLGGYCLALGIASLVLTLILSLFSVSLLQDRSLHYTGIMWWSQPNWADLMFNSYKTFQRSNIPATAWLPFSRGLVILAMSFGFRLSGMEK